MPLPADRLYEAAAALLDAVVAHYAANSVDLPDRRYVSDGDPAWDCDQLVVYVERTYGGLPTAETAEPYVPNVLLRSADIYVEIARCSPVFRGDSIDDAEPADPDEIDANAKVVLADPILIVNAAIAAHRAGDLGGCRGLVLGGWQSLSDGGLAGGRQLVRFQLSEV